jgi:group I intron endonuclease
MENNIGVYQIINSIDGKRYIGSSVNLSKRKNTHFSDLKKQKHKNRHLLSAYNKYGSNNFKFEIILYCSREDAIFYEQRVIDLYNFSKELYNLSPSAKDNLGFKMPQSSKDLLSKINKGKKHTKESKLKMSQSRTGKKNHMYGKRHTEETKEKVRQARKGMIASDETIEKMSKKRKGVPKSEAHKRKMSENNSRKIPIKVFDYINKEYIGEFDSLTKCAKILEIDRRMISAVLKGKLKHCGGYIFEKIEEVDVND